MAFDIAGARQAGYSDDEIVDFMSSQGGDFDHAGARAAGYSASEILDFVGTEREPESSALRRVGDIGISAVKSAIGVPEIAVGLADIVTGGRAGKAAEEAGFRPKEAKEFLDQYLSPEQQAANQRVQDAEGFVDTAAAAIQNPSVIGHTIVESAPAMLAGGLVGRGIAAAGKVAPWLAGAAGEGIVGAGTSAESIRQNTDDGLLTAGQAGAALASGAGTAAFGAAGGRLAQKLGIADIDTMLAGGGSKLSGAGVAQRIIAGGISEGAFEEMPQSAQEQIWQNAALDRPLLDGVPEAAGMGFVTGAAMGGIAGGAFRPKPTIEDIGNSSSVDEAIAAASAVLDSPPQSATDEIGALEQDAGMAAEAAPDVAPEPASQPEIAEPELTDIIKRGMTRDELFTQREAEIAAQEQAARDEGLNQLEEAGRDLQVEQAQAVTEAQGFDAAEPTAMQLAMQRAQERRKLAMTPVSQRQSPVALSREKLPSASDKYQSAIDAPTQQAPVESGVELVQGISTPDPAASEYGLQNSAPVATDASQPAQQVQSSASLAAPESSNDAPIAEPAQDAAAAIRRLEAITEKIRYDKARNLVSGKTEKPGGVDPIRQIDAGEGNSSEYRVGNIPLEMFRQNEDGDLYDRTVDRARAVEYSSRSAQNVPPVIAVISRKTGKLNILDGGHRISAARMRGDDAIPALISMRKEKGRQAAQPIAHPEITQLATAPQAAEAIPQQPALTGIKAEVARIKGMKAARQAQAENKRRSALLASLEQVGATRHQVLRLKLDDAQSELKNLMNVPHLNKQDQREALERGQENIADLAAIEKDAIHLDKVSAKKNMDRAMLSSAKQELDAAVRSGAMTETQASATVDAARMTGNAVDASENIFSAVDEVVDRYLGKYGKGMSGPNARLEAQLRNKRQPEIQWRAEPNEELGYGMHEVVGYQKAAPVERRKDLARRRLVAEMSPEEMSKALLTSEITGIPNKRAFQEHVQANPKDQVLYGDIDDFKAINAKYGHNEADQILRAIGDVKAEIGAKMGVKPFHRSGDEFLATSADAATLEAYGKAVQERLAKMTVELVSADGTVIKHTGTGFSYGTGQNDKAAEGRSDEQKAERKRLGLRTGERDATPVSGPAAAGVEDQEGVLRGRSGEQVAPFEGEAKQRRAERLREALTPASKRGAKPDRSEALTPVSKRAKKIGNQDAVIMNGATSFGKIVSTVIGDAATGKPWAGTVYRGVSGVKTDAGDFGKGEYYTGDIDRAKAYARGPIDKPDRKGKLLTSTVQLQNPIVFRTVGEAREYRRSIVGNELLDKPQSEEAAAMIDADLRARGHDGVVVYDSEGNYTAVPNEPFEIVKLGSSEKKGDPDSGTVLLHSGLNPIEAVKGIGKKLDDATKTKVPEWLKQLPLETQEAAKKAGIYVEKKPLSSRLTELRNTAVKRAQQGIFDQFAPLMELGEREYVLARLTKSSDAPLESLLLYGKPFLNNAGAIDVSAEKGGLIAVLQQLQGEHDRFFAWVAGNRASKLKAQGRENLFTDSDISALKDLNQGKMENGKSRAMLYEKVRLEFNGYSRAVMDIAEKAGIINGDDRSIWESDFYVPFYRVMEDDGFKGPKNVSGMVNQYAFKKLKGGTDNLNDLMQNTLRNWSHLLSASLKNQASSAALKTAEKAGIAEAVPVKQKGSVTILEGGKEKHFMVDDPFIMDAITSLEWAGWNNPAMKWMTRAKHYLTLGVTISPTFKLKNLIRDQISAIGLNPISYNLMNNLSEGWKGTDKESEQYAKMLAGGGLMRFGTFLEDDRALHMKRLINNGVKESSILDTTTKVKDAIRSGYDWWQEVGDRSENITRAAIYKQRYEQSIKSGMTDDEAHLMASFAARDSMDFSLQGQWGSIRFLTQLVPFMNARLQGLYKLGRDGVMPSGRMLAPQIFGDQRTGDKAKAMRFGAVTGTVALASIALMLAYRDDDDWKNREEWDRDTYWWFKIGDTAYRIPKPFEIGAIGTIAERGLETVLNGMDKESRGLFMERLWAMITQTFAMNPIPQLIKPMIDLYANTDSFTGRPIETMGMERLSKEERIGQHTSAVARAAGKITSMVGLSPVQVDHLVDAYFSWLGTHLVMTADFAVHPMMGLPDKPSRRWPDDYFVLGDFAKGLPANQSRYITKFYEQSKEVQQAMADIRYHQGLGNTIKARELMDENRDKIRMHAMYNHAGKQLADIGKRIKIVQARKMDADAKREEIDRLTQKKIRLTKLTEERRVSRQRETQE